MIGGPADFLFPVTIENPSYGMDLPDPAYAALKAKFAGPNVKFAGLRRVVGKTDALSPNKKEKVIAAQVADASLMFDAGRFGEIASNRNYGDSSMLEFGVTAFGTKSCRVLLKFDLAGLPKDLKILGAQMRVALMAQGGGFGDNRTGPDSKFEVFAVRRPWNELPVGDEGHSCWLGPKYIPAQGEHPAKGETWGKEGCDDTVVDRFQELAASADVSHFPGAVDPKNTKLGNESFRFVGLDLSDLVAKWRSGALPNNGVLVTIPNGNHGIIAGSEYHDYPFRPTLLIAYEGADLSTPAPQKVPIPGTEKK